MPPTPPPQAKLYLEDLHAGQRFTSRTHTLSAAEIKAFAREFDPQPFHTDEVAAVDTFFEGLAASGWHTAAITMRLIVETLPLAGGLIGHHGRLEWPQPTRPGDVLRVEIEILEIIPSRSRPARGSAMISYTTLNQRDEVLQTFTCKNLLVRRGGKEERAEPK